MSKNYLITLSSLDWFFFGGEQTHSEEKTAEYFSKSNLLPQQTAVLGMLRYQLLKQNSLLSTPGDSGIDNKRVESLIGSQSFNMNKLNNNLSFGHIELISPVTIARKSDSYIQLYHPAPFDHGYTMSFEFGLRACFNGIERAMIPNDNGTFDHKCYTNHERWINSRNETVTQSDIWEEQTRIGITKPLKGDVTDEKNFYKQEYLKFKDNFCYAFRVTLKNDILHSDYVFLGGQRSMFYMEVREESGSSNVMDLYKSSVPASFIEKNKIVLLSDTYVKNLRALTRLCNFHWTDSVPFRNIETTISTSNYYTKPKKSVIRYHFLKRGSVLYFENSKKKQIERLLYNSQLQKIGYNIYVLKNKEMNTTKMYVINALSNMHVGSGEVSYGIIDNLIQRDPLTTLPCINSSGLKGAIREFFREKKLSTSFMEDVFGSDSKGDLQKTQPGQARFFEASLLSIPVRSNKIPYLMATSVAVIEELIKKLEQFACTDKAVITGALKYLKDLVRSLHNPDSDENWALTSNMELEKAIVEEKFLEAEHLNVENDNYKSILDNLLGENWVVLSNQFFGKICDDNHLPIIARNNLSNGTSANLWYEQILPRYTRLYFIIADGGISSEYVDDFYTRLSTGIFQLGANASIGYGFCRFIDISTLKSQER